MSVYSESESHPVVSVSLWPHWLYRPWNPPGQHTGVGSFSLLQEIFLTQRLTKVSCIASGFFTSWATKETPCIMYFVKATVTKIFILCSYLPYFLFNTGCTFCIHDLGNYDFSKFFLKHFERSVSILFIFSKIQLFIY